MQSDAAAGETGHGPEQILAEQVSSAGGSRGAQGSPAWVGYLIGPVFLLLAAWFMWGPDFIPPRGMIPVIDAALITPAPPRSILADSPTINISGFERTCMDCHRLFPPADDPPARLMQHSHIVVDHGINKQCRNCHDAADKNRLKTREAESITFSQVVRLCADCQGPI